MSDKILKASEVAKHYNVSVNTVKSWAKNGLLPNAKLESTVAGDIWLIPESDLKDFKKPEMGRPPKTKKKEVPLLNDAVGLIREN